MSVRSWRPWRIAALAALAALAAGTLWVPIAPTGAVPVAAVLSVEPDTAWAQATQGPAQGDYPHRCVDDGILMRCLLHQTGPNQDQDELWECATGELRFDQDAQGQEEVSLDGTCAIEVHRPGDPAWVWAGGFADHVQVCPAGELRRGDSGRQWELGPDCVQAAAPSLGALSPPDTWNTGAVAWQDAVPAPEPCGWTLSC